MMDVAPLKRERERLLTVLAEAKTARARLNQINKLLAMYADQQKAYKSRNVTPIPGTFSCPDCDRTFKTPQALGPHRRKVHGYTRKSA